MARRSRLLGLTRTASGSFIIRKRIPPGLRAAAKALHGVAHEWIEPLGTDDRVKAERLYPLALARIIAKQDAAVLASRGGPQDGPAAAQQGGQDGRCLPSGGQAAIPPDP